MTHGALTSPKSLGHRRRCAGNGPDEHPLYLRCALCGRRPPFHWRRRLARRRVLLPGPDAPIRHGAAHCHSGHARSPRPGAVQWAVRTTWLARAVDGNATALLVPARAPRRRLGGDSAGGAGAGGDGRSHAAGRALWHCCWRCLPADGAGSSGLRRPAHCWTAYRTGARSTRGARSSKR